MRIAKGFPALSEKDLQVLHKQLQDQSQEARMNALQTLWQSQAPAFDDQREDAVRVSATDSARVSASNSASFSTIRSLIELIIKIFACQSNCGSELELRIKAAEVLRHKFTQSPEAMRALIAALDEPDEQIRHKIAAMLPDQACYVPELVKAFTSNAYNDQRVRRGIANAIAFAYSRSSYEPTIEAPAIIVQTLISFLSDPDDVIRRCAADALGKNEREGAEAEEALLAALHDSDRTVAFAAAKALRRTNPDHPEANKVFDERIEAELADSDEKVRWYALSELSRCVVNEKYLERVIELLDGTTGDRAMAMQVIEKIGPTAKAAIPRLKQQLLAGESVWDTAKLLAMLQAQDTEILECLASLFLVSYPDWSGARSAAEGLACFGKDGVPYLIRGLEWDRALVQDLAIMALNRIGKDAIEAIPELIETINDDNRQSSFGYNKKVEDQTAILKVVAKIGPGDDRVLQCLGAIAADKSDGRNKVALSILESIGSEPALAIAHQAKLPSPKEPGELENALKLLEHAPDIGVRIKAAEVVAASPQTPATEQALLFALSDPDDRLREAVARVIPPQVVRNFFVDFGFSAKTKLGIAVRALENLGEEKAALLLKALPYNGPDRAAIVVSKSDNNPRAAVSALLRQVHAGHAMFDVRRDGRSDVLDALAKIGPDDERVFECLTELAKQRQPQQAGPTQMAKAAIAALKLIGTDRALSLAQQFE